MMLMRALRAGARRLMTQVRSGHGARGAGPPRRAVPCVRRGVLHLLAGDALVLYILKEIRRTRTGRKRREGGREEEERYDLYVR